MIVPKSATDGEGHKNNEQINILIPNIHHVIEGVFIIFAMGVISSLSLPKSIRHLENAVTSAIVAMISINCIPAYSIALNMVCMPPITLLVPTIPNRKRNTIHTMGVSFLSIITNNMQMTPIK